MDLNEIIMHIMALREDYFQRNFHEVDTEPRMYLLLHHRHIVPFYTATRARFPGEPDVYDNGDRRPFLGCKVVGTSDVDEWEVVLADCWYTKSEVMHS